MSRTALAEVIGISYFKMFIWMPVIAVILCLPSSECGRCHHRKNPIIRDVATGTNFSFVARNWTDFELWWHASCDSWNQEDVISFKFNRSLKNSISPNHISVIHENFTSCRSNEYFKWDETSFIWLEISFRNTTSLLYCYSVKVETFVLPAPKLDRIAVDPTGMSFRDKNIRTSLLYYYCILKYKENQSADDSGWGKVKSWCQGLECKLNMTSLTPAKNYLVKIGCGYVEGRRPQSWSDPGVFSTPEAAPSGMVRDVVTEKIHFGVRRSVNVSWQPVSADHQNGKILFYTISVQGKTCDTSVRVFNTSLLNCILPDLYYRCDYRINISASTSAGASSPRVLHLNALNEMPSEARNFTVLSISNESIQLSWTLPERPNGEVNYNLSVYRVNNGIEHRVDTALIAGSDTGEVERYTVIGLTPFTTYHLKVYAENHALASLGVQLEATTKESVPSEGPADLKLAHLPMQVTNLSVTWGPVPEDQRNGNILSYTVYWWHATSCEPAPPLQASNSTVNKLSYIIEDLEEDTPYCVTVSASTSVGEGPKAKVKSITTQRAAVSVSNITITAKTSGSISLEWSLPEKVNPSLLQLRIYSNEVYHNEVTNYFKLSEGRTSHTLRNLKPYANYSISVQACWDAVSLDSCGEQRTVYARTNSAYPSEPTDLTIRQLAHDHVNLSWHPPLHSNGPISHYQVNITNDAQRSRTQNKTKSLTMSLPFACSTIGRGTVFVFHVAAVVDGLEGPAAKHNTTMCGNYVHRVSDLVIAVVILIPGIVICVILSLICWYARTPTKKIEIKHAKAIYEPKMVTSCADVPEKEIFDMLNCQTPCTKTKAECETYVIADPKKHTTCTLKTSGSKQGYVSMAPSGNYLPHLT